MTTPCTCEGTEAVTFCKDCGIGMTTPTPEEVLREMRERVQHEHLAGDEEKALVEALLAILAMEENKLIRLPEVSYSQYQEGHMNGSNTRLSEVRAIITERLVKG